MNENTQNLMTGGEVLRDFLINDGFKLAPCLDRPPNIFNWYAYRPTKYSARQCECNEERALQIVVRPWAFEKESWGKAEVEVTGEVKGLWFRICAYSVPIEKMTSPCGIQLKEIEEMLIDAWNVLYVKG